jgi:hypothetical protein
MSTRPTIDRKLGSVILHLLAAFFLALPAFADNAARVDELEKKVRDLEASIAAARSAPGTDDERVVALERQVQVLIGEIEALRLGDAASPAADTGRFGLAPAASKVYGIKRGVSIGGYGEMLYENFAGTNQAGAAVATKDQIDFLRAIVYFGYKFDDRFIFNSEIEFEHASSGKNGEVSVEFAYLDFLVRESFNVRAGMVLVPMGFVNELHEPPVFLGARRPYVEQVILPSTWRENGAGVFGEAGPVSYRAYVVSGLAAFGDTNSKAKGFSASGLRDGRSSGSRSAAEDIAFTGRLDVRPVKGLLLGVAAYGGDAGQDRKTALGEIIDARTTILEGHAEFRARGLSVRALYARTKIDDAAKINESSGFVGTQSVGEEQYGWYGEVGYDVLAPFESRHALIPYARYERYDTQKAVPAGFASNPANDVTVTTLGVAWKPLLNIVVKADWNKIENEAKTGADQINVALGYLF